MSDTKTDIKKFSQFSRVSEGPVDVVGLKAGDNVIAKLTTDLVETNPDVTFRDAKGRYRSTEDYEELTNQLKVNRFIANELDAINEAIENIDVPEGVDLTGYATEEWVGEQIDAIELPDDVDLTPVTDRLDSIEEVLPKVPVVIDPVDIGTQVCEITESRPTGAGGKAGSVLIWKAEAGGPANPFNECKLICPDVSAIVLGVRTIWWKQQDRVQRWDMSGGGWFTNGNVLHYSAVETSGDELVDGQPIELYYVDPNSTSDDLLDVISRLESKADDRKLHAEIEELALIVGDALNAVQRDHGAWVYMGDGNTIPRNAGEFTLLTNDLSQSDNIVTLNTTDADGKLHGFNADIEVGEYLEIVDEDDPDDYALFVLTMAPSTNGNLTEFRVALKKSSRSFDIGDRCQVRIIHLDETNADLSELDDRYLKRTGGMMLGNIDMEQNQIYDASSIQSKEIKTPSLDSGQNSNLVIGRNGESRLVIADDSVVAQQPLRLTQEGVNDDHAVTKKYVDEKVGGIDIPETDLSDYVSKTGGDDMQGPLHVKGWGDDSRGTSRVKTLGVFSDSSSALRLGTTSDRIYVEDENTKFNGGILVNNIGPKTEDGRGVTLNVEGNNDKHLVTKKYVDDAVQSGVEGTDLSGLVPLDGSKTMTGALTAPRVNVKTTDYGDGVLLVEGKRDNTNNVAARVTFSNSTNANAYGSIEWYATTGSNGTFKFTNKVKLLEEGTADNDAVTKKYVDDAVKTGVEGIDFPETDLSGLATEEWVNEQIEAIDFPETDMDGYATELYVNQQVALNMFSPGDQVAKIGSSSNNVGSFWVVDGALYCKVN
jgi:hypothetical protein